MPLEGTLLGRYKLTRLLRRTGMSEIYLANDTLMTRDVVVKIMLSDGSPDDNSFQEASRLFQREMRAIASLDHPSILPIFDFGEQEVHGSSVTYMVMPYRPEGSLTDWLKGRGSASPLSLEDIAYILRQAADALQEAHNHQIVHLDVKPSNFLIRNRADTPNRPDVFLADFGIAKFLGTTKGNTGVNGTFEYMPPEQWRGDPKPASDQYSLAVMAYELLAGRPLFRGNLPELLNQHCNIPPIAPSRHNRMLPASVDTVILTALKKAPEERFASVKAFGNAFYNAVSDKQVVQKNGSDIHMALSINERDATTGTDQMLSLMNGKAVVATIPPNTQDGQVIRLGGLGNPGTNGGKAGALLLTVTVTADKITPAPIATNGGNIYTNVSLTQSEAQTGTRRTLTLPDGRVVTASIPAGVLDGSSLRLEGMGSPGVNGGHAGALIVLIAVKPDIKAPPPPPVDGKDIQQTLSLTPQEAQKGTVRPLQLPNGTIVNVPVQPGTYNGQEIRLNGYGEAGFNGGNSGALIVKATVGTSKSGKVPQKRNVSIFIITVFVSLSVIAVIIGIINGNNSASNNKDANTVATPSTITYVSKTLDTYCTAIGDSDYSTAYSQFSTAYRSQHSESDFINAVPISSCTYKNVSVANGSIASARLYFSLGASGSDTTQTVTLVQENGVWKIDTITNS